MLKLIWNHDSRVNHFWTCRTFIFFCQFSHSFIPRMSSVNVLHENTMPHNFTNGLSLRLTGFRTWLYICKPTLVLIISDTSKNITDKCVT